jgi:plastocyanin
VRRRWPGIVALAVAAGGGVGCTRPAPRTHVVEISGFGFRPETLTVAAGDTVRWVNHDAVPHSATAGPDSARVFDSGSIAAGGEWRMVAREGRQDYYCVFHPTMRGLLVVR